LKESHGLPELEVQYAEYAAWQRSWLSGDALLAQIRYWKEKLAGAPTLAIPTDRQRPDVIRFVGKTIRFELGEPLAKSVRALSRKSGATLFMTMLAAFKVLLKGWSGQDDIVIGTDVANRNHIESEGLIGFFVNQLVLRTDISGAISATL
jgi:hypothetical protein